MNIFGKIGLITAGTLAVVVGGGAVLYNTVPNFKSGIDNMFNKNQISISSTASIGTLDINTTHSSREYINLINQYSREIETLRAKLSSDKETYEQNLAIYQAEVDALQAEIAQMDDENEALLQEKNNRIETLKMYIRTIEGENAETCTEYETQISQLNSLLANYESKVIQTIKLPSDFVFTSLGFKVIENNDFIFYSTSHSCKLYFYHFDTETLEALPIKGTSFDSFYKIGNDLYFRTSKMMYRYDFKTKEISILGSANSVITFECDGAKVYMFDYNGGYGVYDKNTEIFTNFLSNGTDSSTVTVKRIDNYILHYSYGVTPTNNKNHGYIALYNTDTGLNKILLDTASNLNSFVKTSNGYYICMGNGFYKLNLQTLTPELILDLGNTTHNCYNIEDKIVLFGNTDAYIYDNTITQIATYEKAQVNPTFIKLSDGLYYVVSNNSAFKGIWKLDLTNKTLIQLSSSFTNYYSMTDIANYKFIGMINGIYVVDMNTGTIDTLTVTNTNYSYKLTQVDCGNYVVFYCNYTNTSYSSFIYFYDKVNDVYGKIFNGTNLTVKGTKYQNCMLYVMTTDSLYSFNLDLNMNNYIDRIVIDSSLSNIEVGVFYASAGQLDGSKLYIKYTLQDDGTFVKDLVII